MLLISYTVIALLVFLFLISVGPDNYRQLLLTYVVVAALWLPYVLWILVRSAILMYKQLYGSDKS